MRFYLLGIVLGLLTTSVFAKEKEKGKEKDIGRKTYYQCTGNEITISYKISYTNPDFEVPPCKVYEIINGEERKIGESKKTEGVCEDVLEHLFTKLERSGMTCFAVLK